MMKALLLTAALMMAIPMVSAGHNVCSNEDDDIDVAGVTGVDTGSDGDGTHVCADDQSVGVDADDPPQGTGAVVEVLHCDGASSFPCDRLLAPTGVYTFQDSSGTHICIVLNGDDLCNHILPDS